MDEKRLIWTDEQLNCYGFWVRTEGISTRNFDRNPIMLFNHHRTFLGKKDEILPTGTWKEYRKEADGRMTGVPVFDMKDDFAVKIANKVEGGFLSACSIGIRILEVSEDPQYLKPGQTRATVTKCELKEVSVVDIPANPNAAGVVLYDADDNVIELTDDGKCPVRLINNQNRKQMKEVALKLGLQEGASEAEVLSAVVKLQDEHAQEVAILKAAKEAADTEVARLKKEKEDAVAAEAVTFADQLLKAGKITADAKDATIEMFKANPGNARKIFGGVPARTKLSDLIGKSGDGTKYASMSWDELDRAGLLAELKVNDPDLYEKKYQEMAASLRVTKG